MYATLFIVLVYTTNSIQMVVSIYFICSRFTIPNNSFKNADQRCGNSEMLSDFCATVLFNERMHVVLIVHCLVIIV